MRLYDSHAHYNDQKFEGLEGGASALLSLLHEEGVDFVLNAATDTPSCYQVLSLAEQFDFCRCAIGVHPEGCGREESPEALKNTLRALATHPKVVAIGEIGLDYYWEDYPAKDIQAAYFKAQLDLVGTPEEQTEAKTMLRSTIIAMTHIIYLSSRFDSMMEEKPCEPEVEVRLALPEHAE